MGNISGDGISRDLYVFEQTSVDGKKLKRFIEIEGNPEVADVKQVASTIFNKALEDTKPLKVTITKDAQNRLQVSIKGQATPLTAAGPAVSVHKLTKLTPVTPTSQIQAKKNLLQVVLGPVLTIIRYLSQKAHAKEHAAEVKHFIDDTQCRNMNGLLALLKTSHEIVAQENRPDIGVSILMSEKVLAALDDSSKIDASVDEIIKECINPIYNQTKTTIGLGYYTTDQNNQPVFHPLLLSISDNGKKASFLTSDSKAPQELTLEVDPLDKEKLKKLVKSLILMAKEPSSKAISSTRKTQISRALNVMKEVAPAQSTTISQESPWILVEKLAKEVFPTTLQRVDPIQEKTVHTPATLLSSYLQGNPKQIQAADKAILSLELLATHLASKTKDLERFSINNQITILHELLYQYDMTQELLEEALGIEESLEALTAELPEFQNLRLQMNQIRQRLLKLEALKKSKEQISHKQTLESLFSEQSTAQALIPNKLPGKRQHTQAISNSSPAPPITAQAFTELEHAITISPQEALAKLIPMIRSLDALVDAKEYETAKRQAVHLLQLLPVPKSTNNIDTATTIVTPDTFWANLNSSAANWQEELLALSSCLFESKLKIGDMHSSPSELIAITKAQAIQLAIIREKAKPIHDKIIATLKQKGDEEPFKTIIETMVGSDGDLSRRIYLVLTMNKHALHGALFKACGITDEKDLSLMLYTRWYCPQSDALAALCLNDKYLLSHSPQEHKDAMELLTFFQQRKKIPIQLEDITYQTNYYCVLDIINQGAKLQVESKSSKQLVEDCSKIHSDYLSLDKKCLNESLAGELHALRELQLMSSCMVHPESTLYLQFSTSSFIGKKNLGKWLLKIVSEAKKGNPTPEEERKKLRNLQQQDVVERLTSMGRLKIALGQTVIGGNACLTVLPRTQTGNSEIDNGLMFEKHGLELPDAKRLQSYNPNNSSETTGSTNYELAQSYTMNNGFDPHAPYSWWNVIRYDDSKEKPSHREAGWLLATLEAKDPVLARELATMRMLETTEFLDDSFLHYHSAINALNFICQYPEKLSDIEVQRFVDATLFRPPLLLKAISKHPAAFQDAVAHLQSAIETLFSRQEYTSAAYLMHASSELQVFIQSQKDLQLKAPFPTYSSTYSYADSQLTGSELLDIAIKKEESLTNKTILFIYQMESKMVCGKLPDSPQEWTDLLKHYFTLKDIQPGFGINYLQKEIINWFEEHVIPHAITKDTFSTEILPALAATLKMSPQGWQQVGNTPIFTNKHNERIDFQQGTLKQSIKEGSIQGPEVVVPTEVMSIKQCKKVFGGISLTATRTNGLTPSQTVYHAVINGKKIEIHHNKDTQEASIFVELEPHLAPNTLFQYVDVTAKTPKHTDALLIHYGLWVDPSQKKGRLIADNPLSFAEENCFTVELSAAGHIQKLAQKGFSVIFDPAEEKTAFLPCFASSRIIIEKRGLKPDLIRIIGTALTFSRQGKDWIYTSKTGAYTIQEQHSQELSRSCRQFLDTLGPNSHECAIALRGEQEERVLLLPHTIIGAKKEGARGQIVLDFAKAGIDEDSPNAIEVAISKGKIATSCSGYLYLAALAAHQKEYKRALYYLEEAKLRRLGPGEKALFEKVASMLSDLPEGHVRETSFKLKANLLVSSIKRIQIGARAFEPGKESEFLAVARKMAALHEKHTHLLAEKQHFILPIVVEDLQLSASEIEELKAITNESLAFLAPKAAEPLKSIDRTISGTEVKSMTALAIAYAEDSGKIPPLDIRLLPRASSKLLTHLPYYIKQVYQEKITAKELEHLFYGLELLPGEGKEIQQAIDTARTLLYNIASQKIPGKARHLYADMAEGIEKDFLKLKSKLPKSSGGTSLLSLYRLAQKAMALEKILPLSDSILNLYKPGNEPVETPNGAPIDLKVAGAELAKKLQEPNSPFTQREIVAVTQVQGFENEATESNLFEKLASQKIDLRAMRKEEELAVTIEKRKAMLSHVADAIAINLSIKSQTPVATAWSFIKATAAKAIPQAAISIPTENSDPLAGMKTYEEKIQQLGIEAAAREYQEELQTRTIIPDEVKRLELVQNVEARSQELQEQVSHLKAQIQDQLKRHKKNPQVRAILRLQGILSDDMMIDKLLAIYARAQGTSDAALDQLITQFLVAGIELKTTGQALKILHSLKGKLDLGNEDAITSSTRVKQLLASGSNHTRYCDTQGTLLDPTLHKKFLVAEYRRGIILRKGQIDAINKIRQDPSSLLQLRMGLGKTSYILPIVMQLLAEDGKLPIALVPEELFNMNLESMDTTTRELFEQAAICMKLDSQTLENTTLLAQELDRLLEAKQNHGFVIATIEELALLEHKFTLVSEEIGQAVKRLQAVSSDPNKKEKVVEISGEIAALERKRYWLSEIKSLFSDPTTQFFADEADDIFSVIREINVAVAGKPLSFSGAITTATKEIFEFILQSENPVQKALIAGTTAALSKVDISHMQTALISSFAAKYQLDATALTNFVFGKTKTDILQVSANPQLHNTISSFATIVGATLPDVLSKSAEIDYDIQSTNGYKVGPRRDKQEKVNTNFGDQYELSVYHFVRYAAHGPSDAFLQDDLKQIRFSDPDYYQRLLHIAAAAHENVTTEIQTIIQHLKRPENWKMRLEYLEKRVIGQDKIALNSEQLELNVHDVIRGLKCGGISGTMTPASFPEVFTKPSGNDAETNARKVEAETYVKIAAGLSHGFDTQIKQVPDNEILSTIASLVTADVRAIINIGLSIDGKDTNAIIQDLAAKLLRPIVYVDPQERQSYIYDPATAEHSLWPQNKEIPPTAVVYFDPADKRGTDFIIPPGKGLFIPGTTTQEDQFAQGVWRMRQLGFSQIEIPLITESQANRIREAKNIAKDAPITFKDMIADIKAKTLEQEAQKNIKAKIVQIKGVAFTCLRKFLYAPKKHSEDYWSVDATNPLTSPIIDDAKLHDLLFSKVRDYFIKPKVPLFTAESPTQTDIKAFIEKLYDSEISKIDALLQTLAQLPLDTLHDKTYAQATVLAFTAQIETLKETLLKQKSTIVDAEELTKQLAAVVKDTTSSTTGSQTQQMQMQQQTQSTQSQQQQQTQSQISDLGKEIIEPEKAQYISPRKLSTPASYFQNHELDIPPEELVTISSLSSLDGFVPAYKHEHFKPRITISGIAGQLMLLKSKQTADGLFRVIIKHTSTGIVNLAIIGKQDIVQLESTKYRFEEMTAFALDRRTLPNKDIGVTTLASYSPTSPIETKKEECLSLIAEAKLYLGYTNFTEIEKEALATWVKTLTPQAYEGLRSIIQETTSLDSLALLESARNL